MVYVLLQMLHVRQLLTEVLLDVTNTEIADVAHAVYMSAKMKEARGSRTVVTSLSTVNALSDVAVEG